MANEEIEIKQREGYKEAIKRIEEASINSAKSLDLQNLWLTKLPPEVFSLKNLQSLNVYCNDLSEIPDAINTLEGLQTLELGLNHIKSLPQEIYKLSSLRKLSVNTLGSGGIRELSNEIGNLQELIYLDISGHILFDLPAQLREMKKLQTLRLSDNRFKNIPDGIFYLENLHELYLNDNCIEEIPYEIEQLRSLKKLDLSNSDNKFFGNNKIVSLPTSIRKLKNLKYLNLANNPLPMEQKILSYPNEPNEILDTYFNDIVLRIQPKSKSNIFINYSRLDQISVEEIYGDLTDAGYSPWMDVHDLKGGEIWLEAIEKAIDECELFIAVLSDNSVNRRGVLQKELKAALDKWDEMLPDDIYLIPIRLDSCPIPDRLKSFHVLDWEDGKNKDKLLQAIQVGLSKRRK